MSAWAHGFAGRWVINQLEGAENIVRVLETPLGNHPLEDDLFRFLEIELGALDPV